MDRKFVESIKTPQECTAAEIGDFAALVVAGGEVAASGLQERIRDAHSLVFMREGKCLVGVAALKQPPEGRRIRVFAKAHATADARDYLFELGWVFVMPSARENKLSLRLTNICIASAQGKPIYSTSRTDMEYMSATLLRTSFVKRKRSMNPVFPPER